MKQVLHIILYIVIISTGDGLTAAADMIEVNHDGFSLDLNPFNIFKLFSSDETIVINYKDKNQLCLGFLNYNCYQVKLANLTPSSNLVAINPHNGTIMLGPPEVMAKYFPQKNTAENNSPSKKMISPRLLQLTRANDSEDSESKSDTNTLLITNDEDQTIIGGLTEIIPDSQIFATAIHVVKRYGYANLVKNQKEGEKLFSFIINDPQSLSVPDIVFFSNHADDKFKIQTWLRGIANNKTAPFDKWISWHFAQTEVARELRGSQGVWNRLVETAKGNPFFILDKNNIDSESNLATSASSGAILWNIEKNHAAAVFQCWDKKSNDIYALNLEDLNPIYLEETSLAITKETFGAELTLQTSTERNSEKSTSELLKQKVERFFENYKMPQPPGFGGQRKCIPLGGGDGDAKDGGGADHEESDSTVD